MKFLNAVFLSLSISILVGFAQTVGNQNKPDAIKLQEFEIATDGYVKALMDSFYVELDNNPDSQCYIINYGTPKDIARREAQIKKSIAFRRYDSSRITIVNAGFRYKIKTEFWRVPPGADRPYISDNKIPQNILKPIRFEKIGKQSEHFNQWIFGEYFRALKSRENVNGHILINANDAEYADFEKKLRSYISFSNIQTERIFIKKGNPQNPLTTELWFVPKELKSPKFTKKAEKLAEFGLLKSLEWKRKMKEIAKTVSEIRHENSQLYIVTYGKLKDISVGERLIEKYLLENCRECYGYTNFKINFVRGNSIGKARRVFWLVPEDGEIPKF